MKSLSRQDKNGVRTAVDLERRYKFNDIDYTKEEIEKLKTDIIVDSALSTTSTSPVQNRVVTQALNKKVNTENGKGLSSNDFTDELKNKVETMPTKVSELTNDAKYITQEAADKKYCTNESANEMADSLETYANLMNKKVPSGGTTGQVLAKKSNTDNDTQWIDQAENAGVTAITNSDLNQKIGELIIGYGNSCTNKPTDSQNGFLINLPHTGSPATYNKQFWFNRMNNCIWSRSMENGVWTEWKPIDEDMKKSYNLASYKVSGLTITRATCITKSNRVVMNFTGIISMAANTTTTLFNLPAELRPKEIKDFIVFGQNNNNDGYIGYGQISTTGTLQVRFNTAISSYIRFSITYDLD